MDLKVGMFVRTYKGTIFKVDWLNKMYYGTNQDEKGKFYRELFKDINGKRKFKASFNIIDLIEVGDYVNGIKILNKFYDDFEKQLVVNDDPSTETWVEWNYSEFTNDEINSVVTKEQFESMEYRIGDTNE